MLLCAAQSGLGLPLPRAFGLALRRVAGLTRAINRVKVRQCSFRSGGIRLLKRKDRQEEAVFSD